jgi:hypothetical protein
MLCRAPQEHGKGSEKENSLSPLSLSLFHSLILLREKINVSLIETVALFVVVFRAIFFPFIANSLSNSSLDHLVTKVLDVFFNYVL